MRVVSLIWGLVALGFFAIGLIPCLGWINWFNVPWSLVGVVISILAMARSNLQGKGVGMAIGGLAMNVCAVVVGSIRLVLGGGIV